MSVKGGCVYIDHNDLHPSENENEIFRPYEMFRSLHKTFSFSEWFALDSLFVCFFVLRVVVINEWVGHSRTPVMGSLLRVAESMWHSLNSPGCYVWHMVCRPKKITGQVEVTNEFNQAHVRLIDIYCSLNRIHIDSHLAHEITVTAGTIFQCCYPFPCSCVL